MNLAQMNQLMKLVNQFDMKKVGKLMKRTDLPSLLEAVADMTDDQLMTLRQQLTSGDGAVTDAAAPVAQPPDEDVVTEAVEATPPAAHRPFRTAAVLGAGTMGAQIAAHLANAGLDVLLLDMAAEGDDKNAVVKGAFKRIQKLKPAPFFTNATAERITLGNFDDDVEQLADVDWVIEAVVERMDIKRSLMARVEAAVGPHTVVATNTSGLPIHQITEGRSEGFKRRFLGTHFFNPPRYLQLLELIPTPDTDPAVLERVASFGRVHLGKGIVVANDVPYFIGNRIGVYGMMRAMEAYRTGDFTLEEIDALTGPLMGRPKSATFRTADLVGLDVMRDVANNLHSSLEHDESRDAFRVPDVLDHLVENKQLGQKTKAGFYKKTKQGIFSLNPETLDYEAAHDLDLGDLDAYKKLPLGARLRALYEDDGRAGAFFREHLLDLLAYSARRIGEITENPANVDKAIRWGFGWEKGPFQIWDALGVERTLADMRAAGHTVPDWIDTMQGDGATTFYRSGEVYVPGQGYQPNARPADEYSLAAIKSDAQHLLWENDEASLVDLGDGVALYEFRSKANSLGTEVMGGLAHVLDKLEADADLRGLVIGNEGTNFSVGANLGEAAMAVSQGAFDAVEEMVAQFQQLMQRIHYAEKPVVVAAHQRVLGGGCEMVMSCTHPVAAAESYIGLVELGVGLIPAGTGTMRLAAQAAERAPNGHPSEIQSVLMKYFLQVAMAEVATSARQAQDMGYLADHAVVVMHADRRLHVAKQEVLRLSEQGYLPPPRRTAIPVLGRDTKAAIAIAVDQYKLGGFVSDYDQYLANQFAHALCGGDLTGMQTVTEDYLLDLEREVFLRLLGQEKTRDRIMHILTTNKPLRN